MVLHERRVEIDGLLLLLGIRAVHRDAVSGDGERRLADAVADHARLAEGEVVSRLRDDRERARWPRGDVLDLSDDTQPVLGKQVELRDPDRCRS